MQNPTETHIGHSYIRFSTKDQSEGDSKRRQSDTGLERFCKKHNLTLSALTLLDAGISGFHGKNFTKGALAGFVKAIEAGTVKAGEWLVIESVDRITRMTPRQAMKFIEQIIDKGVTIGVIDSDLILTAENLDDAKRSTLDELYGELKRAHRESLRKSELSKENWNQKRLNAKAGKPQASRYPAWIVFKDGKFEFEPTRTAIMMELATHLLAGRGYQWIAGEFAKAGYATFNKKNGQWCPEVVKYLANTRTTIGEYQPGKVNGPKRTAIGDAIQNYYPAVWTPETFTKIQAIPATRRRAATQGRTGDATTNLFGSLLMNARDNSVGDNVPVHQQ